MKFIFTYIAIILVLASCHKEEIKPIIQEQVSSVSCDTCNIYSVSITIDNPDHTFVVHHNNSPVTGNFQMCSGDTLSWTMTQDCEAFGYCGQWTVDVLKDGVFLFGSASNASTANHLYFTP